MGRLARRRERKQAEARAKWLEESKGEKFDGEVVRVNDPALVQWPGWYTITRDEAGEASVNYDERVGQDTDTKAWVRM